MLTKKIFQYPGHCWNQSLRTPVQTKESHLYRGQMAGFGNLLLATNWSLKHNTVSRRAQTRIACWNGLLRCRKFWAFFTGKYFQFRWDGIVFKQLPRKTLMSRDNIPIDWLIGLVHCDLCIRLMVDWLADWCIRFWYGSLSLLRRLMIRLVGLIFRFRWKTQNYQGQGVRTLMFKRAWRETTSSDHRQIATTKSVHAAGNPPQG